MENEIIKNISNPAALESLYRSNPAAFSRAFEAVYPQISKEIAAQIWQERLAVSTTSWGSKNDWILLVAFAVIGGFFMQLPDLVHLSHDRYFPRNMSFFVMPGIGAYFAISKG
jgi:hypothetical protein